MLTTTAGVVSQIFTPKNVSSIFYWIDCGDTSTITELSNKVSQIDDKSDLGNNFTQISAGSQPTTNTVTVNGRNVLDFNGSSEGMTSAAFLQCSTNNVSLICVLKSDVSTSSFRIAVAEWDNTTNARTFVIGQNSGNNHYASNGPGNVINTITSATAPRQSTITRNTSITSMTLYLNGTLETTVLGSVEPGTTVSTLGGTSNGFTWDGYIAEVIAYREILTTVQRTKLRRRIKATWGI